MSFARPSICFVAPMAHPFLLGIPGTHGGAEVQQTLLARALAARGWRVSFVTLDHGGPREVVKDGIRVLSSWRWSAGVAGLRFFPRTFSMWRAMDRAGAGIYLHQVAGALVGVVGAYCRARGRRFVFQTASVNDVNGGFERRANLRDRFLFHAGLGAARTIIVQAEEHRRLLLERRGRDSVVIPNGHPLPPRPAGPGAGRDVVWIGMIRPVKGVERFLDLAALLPELRFVLIGDNDQLPGYIAAVRARAAALPNVEMRGRRTRDEIFASLREALCLVNTSDHEGFPNTYIEAWSMGVPVFALGDVNDPDGRIRRLGLGAVASTLDEMAAQVRELALSPERRAPTFERCRSYVEREHDLERVVEKYEELFRKL